MEMNTILTNVLLGLVSAICSTIVPWALYKLGQFISSKAKDSKSTFMQTAYGEIAIAARTVVESLQATVVEGIKAASKDGQLTKEEAINIKKSAVDNVLSIINKSTIDNLGKDGCNVQLLIENVIESQLVDVKDREIFKKKQEQQ